MDSDRVNRFKTTIEEFLQARLASKIEKLDEADPERIELIERHHPARWIGDQARQARQIQLATFIAKPTFPDARIDLVSSLNIATDSLTPRVEVGSHSIQGTVLDVTGNAAVFGILRFLDLAVDGQSLLHWAVEKDPDFLACLNSWASGDAAAWADAFAAIEYSPSLGLATHSRMKQMYWLTGDDPTDDGQYALLAPLYASSLAHAVYLRINTDRFGDEAKAARQAKRDGVEHEAGFSNYPELAVQKLGGTKPQNISQLNSERRGDNYLLASLPPQWRSQAVREPLRVESVFGSVFARRREVRDLLQALRGFLRSDPPSNMETRKRVDGFLDSLIDELVAFAQELELALPPGWSADPRCRLVEAQRLWLDPGRAANDEAWRERWLTMDWAESIGARFGDWLNAALGDDLRLGEIEARRWKDELLADERGGGWAVQVDIHRRALNKATRLPDEGDAT